MAEKYQNNYSGSETISNPAEKYPIITTNIVEAVFSLLDDNGDQLILDENGQIPPLNISGSNLIPLKEWAVRNGISPATARQKAGRGGFITARKIGRDWMISASEPRIDHREKLVQKEMMSPSDPIYTYRILNYLYRLNSSSLPQINDENRSHRAYCKKIFIQLRSKFSGNILSLFEIICDAIAVQEDADVYYISHEEIMSVFEDEAWHTQSKESQTDSAVTIDFNDYLNVLKNTSSDMVSQSVELKMHGGAQTLFMPWYHSLSWDNERSGGLYFIPSNFFKMILQELR